MSQYPKKYHGSELKCAGPPLCSDCVEKLKDRMSIDTLASGIEIINYRGSIPPTDDEISLYKQLIKLKDN